MSFFHNEERTKKKRDYEMTTIVTPNARPFTISAGSAAGTTNSYSRHYEFEFDSRK